MINSEQILKIATSSIGSSKLRSALTILGIMIGVAAVVTNVSIGSSFNQYFTDKISSVGSNFIIAYSKQPNIEKTFKVNGIIQKSKTSVLSNSGDLDSRIFIPISTLNEMTGEKDYGQFFAMANSPESVSEVSDKVDERLARSFGVQKKDIDDEAAKPYGVVNQAGSLRKLDR